MRGCLRDINYIHNILQLTCNWFEALNSGMFMKKIQMDLINDIDRVQRGIV